MPSALQRREDNHARARTAIKPPGPVRLVSDHPWLQALKSGSPVWLVPSVSFAASLIAGNASAAFFSALAVITWGSIYGLLVDLGHGRGQWIRAARWVFWTAAVVGIGVSAASFHYHVLPKLAYSGIIAIFMMAAATWAAIRWTTAPIAPSRIVKEATALLVVIVWLLYADSDWYLMITMPFSTHRTTSYLVALPLWWWLANIIVPAVALAAQARSLGLSPAAVETRWQAGVGDPAQPRHFIVATGLLLVLLTALFLSLDCVLPRVGHQIYEGDEFGYVVSAYQLLQSGRFTPPHMPLISLYIAAAFAIAGDSPTALLVGNVVLVVLAVAFWLGTLRLMTSDMRIVLSGGLLMASLRSQFLYVSTPLSETLNNSLWSAAFFSCYWLFDDRPGEPRQALALLSACCCFAAHRI